MSLRKRGVALGAVVAAGALTLAACSSGSGGDTGGTGGTGGTYSIGSLASTNFAPSNCYDAYCVNVVAILFTGLYTFQTEGETMKAVPTGLNKSVTSDDNGNSYTIEINPGSKFTNGEELTAQTFVDTWNFTANGGNGQKLGFMFGPTQLNVKGYSDVSGEDSTDGKMAGLKVVNDTTFTVELEGPIGKPLFENILAGPQVYPMPSMAFDDIKAYDAEPIGNGPYQVDGPYADTGVTVSKNEDYAYTPGKADKIEFKFYAKDTPMWADLQANEVDVVYILPTIALSQASVILGDRYINEPGMGFSYEGYPTQTKTFAKRDVRVALAKAVNWDEINSKFYFGTRTVGTGFGPPSVPGGGLDVCGEDCTFDPAAAKQLLDGAGGMPDDKVTLATSADGNLDVAEAECNQIQANLGITCELEVFPSFEKMVKGYQEIAPGDTGFILGLGWSADNPTLQNMIAPIFGTGADTNYINYSNPQFDSLIKQGNQATEEDAAIAKWQAAEAVVYKDFAGHATQWRNNVGGYSTNVSNVQINPGNIVNAAEITVNSAG